MSSVSTTTNSYGSLNIPQFNIGGLASGLDTNSIISALMSVAQLPQQQIINQENLETARQSDLTAIQTQLTSLQTQLATLISPSTWTTSQTITSSDPTLVTATGTGVPPGGFQIAVSQLARAQQLTQSTSLQNASAADQLTIQVGSNSAFNVSVSAGDSLQTIATAINQASNTEVYASVVNSKLVLSSQVTGTANTMSVTSTGTLASDLGLTQTVSPLDAQYTVDGGSTQTSSSNILTNVASGLSITLLGTTSSPVSVNVSTPAPNNTAVESAIQDFVKSYNTTIDMITAKLNEQKVINPSTDAQRAQGDLEGDPNLESLLSQLRESVSDVFSGLPSSLDALSQAGLSTGAAVGTGTISQSSLTGDLTLDTTALDTALNTNFDAVKQMFSNQTSDYSTQGLVQRMNGILDTYIGPSGVINSAISSESSIISELAQQKTEWDTRLAQKEQMLRTEFTNMELAMNQAQSQGSWLGGMVSGLATSALQNATASTSSSTSSTSSSTSTTGG